MGRYSIENNDLQPNIRIYFQFFLNKNDENYYSHQRDVDFHESVLNVKRDIFDVFDWNLLQHMNSIVVNGGDCKKLIVTFDADLSYEGKDNSLLVQYSNVKFRFSRILKIHYF